MFRDPRKQKHKSSHSEVHLTSFRINDRAQCHSLVLAVSCWELKSPCIKKKKWHKLFGLLNTTGGQCPSLCQVVAPPVLVSATRRPLWLTGKLGCAGGDSVILSDGHMCFRWLSAISWKLLDTGVLWLWGQRDWSWVNDSFLLCVFMFPSLFACPPSLLPSLLPPLLLYQSVSTNHVLASIRLWGPRD